MRGTSRGSDLLPVFFFYCIDYWESLFLRRTIWRTPPAINTNARINHKKTKKRYPELTLENVPTTTLVRTISRNMSKETIPTTKRIPMAFLSVASPPLIPNSANPPKTAHLLAEFDCRAVKSESMLGYFKAS